MTDFSDATKWNLIMNLTENAVVNGTIITQKIAAFQPSHLFTSAIIAVQVSNSAAKATWHKGGYLTQIIQVGFSSNPATGEKKFVSLNTPKIIDFLLFPSNYQISFQCPSYFTNCTFQVWEFIGT